MNTDDEALHAALTEISGIGDARAAQIIETVHAHAGDADADRVADLLDDAVSYADQGDYEYAMQFVRQARDELA